jgi:LssY C-terminus
MRTLAAVILVLAQIGTTTRVNAEEFTQVPLAEIPQTTAPKKKSKKTADSVNLILLGSRAQVFYVFDLEGWKTSDRISLRSSTKEVVDSLEKKSYLSAPVSTQYLFHRKQDFAFELEEGSARKRHHVRFWEMPDHANVWVGAATEDIGLLIKPARGVISHRVNPDVDLEREFVVQSLEKGCAKPVPLPGTRAQHISRLNAQGVRYFTDGELAVLSTESCVPTALGLPKPKL